MEMNYCRRCGKSLVQDGEAFTCDSGHFIYPNPIPTVSLFLIDESKTHIILPVRGRDPGKGMLDAFGGFIDIDETAEDAAFRELAEESGLTPDDISEIHYISTGTDYYDQGGENRPLLCTAYWATLKSGVTPRPQDDIADCITFRLNDVPTSEFAGEDNKKAFIKLRDLIERDKK